MVALDHLGGFVVPHHAVLAHCRYTYFNRQHCLLSSAPAVDSE